MIAFACEFNRSTQHFILWVKEGVLQMKYRTRTHYTDSQKALMWDRWQKGDSMKEIGRLFD
ncbi:MAG: hypothetical protein ACI9NT_001634 [Bacteroidia bacterium]|jgi:hypothetical protein